MHRTLIAAAVVAGLTALVGCGGSDEPTGTSSTTGTTATTATTPAPVGDPRPRVEGKWRVLYTPEDVDRDPTRVTWTVEPRCAAGACSFRAKSSAGTTFRFLFDRALGDYQATNRYSQECVNLDTGEVIAERAYRTVDRFTLNVSQAVMSDDRSIATEIYGERRARAFLRPEYVGTCDGDGGAADVEMIRAVRVDPPPGTPRYVDEKGNPLPDAPADPTAPPATSSEGMPPGE